MSAEKAEAQNRAAGHKDHADRDVASAAAAALCVQSGANIVRTHNVGATRDAVGCLTW